MAVGVVAALVMVVLGLWQMQVFVDKGNRTIEARAEQAPVPLLANIPLDGPIGDVYGKQVTVEGRYLPDQQLTIPDADARVRVLTAFQVADGRVLPVVRGTGAAASVTAPPPGVVTQTGLFLPGEGDADAAVGAGQIGSVRMPLLAQRWPQRLTPGFVTLAGPDAAAQGLAQAAVDLPEGEGSFQNGGYALQWWIFAAFAVAMSLKVAQGLGARERAALEEAARLELATTRGAGDPSAAGGTGDQHDPHTPSAASSGNGKES